MPENPTDIKHTKACASRVTYRWIKTDELQIPALEGQDRFKLSIIRRVWFRWGGFESGVRFAFARPALPHEVGHATPAARNLILLIAVYADKLWMNLVTLRAFDLEEPQGVNREPRVVARGHGPGRSIRSRPRQVQTLSRFPVQRQ